MKRISDKLEKLIQEQIANEENSSRLYRSMSEWLEYNGWFGAAKLFKKYSEEEMTHMHKFMDYLQDRDCLPFVPSLIEQPKAFKGIKDIIDLTYNHEIKITTWITDIALAALNEKDLVCYQFLNPLISEQCEEEKKALYWIDRYNMIESSKSPMIELDKEMGS